MTCPSCNASNPANARYCTMCGEQIQEAGSRERRRVSVVFIDLTAFTTLTLGFDPEELRDLADEVLTVVAGIIEDYDGYVDAFRGDGLIALFGAPRSHPDDPQRAVLAAAAGLRAIESIGRSRGYPLKGRAGVNTGIVIAGAVGSGRVRDYTVMGSTVNLAARLEAAAIPGEVWVGPETFESTRHRLVYEMSPPVRLAGFPNVTHAFRLVSSLDAHNADPYTHLRFVGRDAELERLEGLLREAKESGRVAEMWILGETGSGKTRLLREFARRSGPAGTTVMWMAGNPAENPAWTQLGRQILGLQDGEELRVRQQKAQQALDALLPGKARQHEEILASLGLRDAAARSAGTRRSGADTSSAWRDLIVTVARRSQGGAILAVDGNAHDPSVREMLAHLRDAQAPLLVLRTGRDRRAPPGVTTLVLEPLSAEASLELLNQIANPVLKSANESLIPQVSGVPAHVIELGRALSSTRSGSFSGSLASLLQARLDLLAPGERQMLTLAALTGERSWERLLTDLSRDAGVAEIQRLVREKLLVPEPASGVPGQVAYRFQSELLRQAVLRMIPFGDRPILHLRIGSWLEQHAPLALSELIGQHFRDGGSPDAAYPHYLAAADLAASRNDPRAVELFEALLDLDVPAELKAQGALAFAQAALDMGKPELCRRQLDKAASWIADADPDARSDLAAAERGLRDDLARASRKTGT